MSICLISIKSSINMDYIKLAFKNSKYLTLFILLFPYLIWYLMGENSYVQIHDSLDHALVYLKVLLNSGNLFNYSKEANIENIMNGIPRGVFRSGFNFTFLLFRVFSPIYAYITNHLIVHLIGFVGMHLLLSNYFIKNNRVIVSVISLMYGYLSYYHIQFGLGIAGQPFLLFAFLNILNYKKAWYNWLLIIGFPFYSFFVYSFPFYIPFLALIILIRYYQRNKVNPKIYLALLIMFTLYIIIELPLIRTSFLTPDYISHRIDFNKLIINGHPTMKSIGLEFINNILWTKYHAGKMATFPILISLLYLKCQKRKYIQPILIVISLLLFIVLWDSLYPLVLEYLSIHIKILKTFDFERIFFLSPFLWLLLFALVLNQFNWTSSKNKIIGISLIFIQILNIAYYNPEITNNIRNILAIPKKDKPSFRQFYAEDLFFEIQNKIGKPLDSYRIISIGLFPNIAQFNGFYTLDSYQNNYPLAFKKNLKRLSRMKYPRIKVLMNTSITGGVDVMPIRLS